MCGAAARGRSEHIRARHTLPGIDLDLYRALNGWAVHHDGLEDVLRFFAQDAQFLFAALLAALFLVRGKWRTTSGRHGVIAAGFSAGLALAVAQLVAHAWDRPRPYVAHPHVAHLFIARSHDSSFPSDHATASFAIAVALFLRHRKVGVLALVMATVVSVARVVVGTHYPSDVVGGAALGAACAVLLWLPFARNRLHALADWIAGLYEAAADRVLRVPRRAAT